MSKHLDMIDKRFEFLADIFYIGMAAGLRDGEISSVGRPDRWSMYRMVERKNDTIAMDSFKMGYCDGFDKHLHLISM